MDVCNAILIEQDDNVAVVIEAVAQDGQISYYQGTELKSLRAAETIPLYHKVAVRKILKGENIIKYGEAIGRAANEIMPGCCVHIHNVESFRGMPVKAEV